MTSRRLQILLVEDDAIHAKIIRRALESRGHVGQWRHVDSAEAALDYLLHTGPADDAGWFTPDLVLLDVRLPAADGFDVLRAIRADERTRRIPVVMLTTSDDPLDVRKAYTLGANAYVAKPTDFEALTRRLAALDEFWAGAVELPR